MFGTYSSLEGPPPEFILFSVLFLVVIIICGQPSYLAGFDLFYFLKLSFDRINLSRQRQLKFSGCDGDQSLFLFVIFSLLLTTWYSGTE